MATALFSRASGFGPLFAIIEAEHGAEALRCLRRESGFAAAAHAPSALVPFALMNRVYNSAAKLCGDPQFGARVGQTIRLEDFGPFVEYALHGETLGDVIARSIVAQPAHSSELIQDLRLLGGEARWRIRYQTTAEPTVEHHAQRTLMQMLAGVRRAPGVQDAAIEIHVAEPYAAEARILEDRTGVRVRPRANDYELAFPARWLGVLPLAIGLPPDLAVEWATYPDRALPRTTAEAALAALDLRDKLPGIGAIAADIGLPSRTLQHALHKEGVSYRELVGAFRLRRALQLLATTRKPVAEVALRAGYSEPSSFARAFRSQTGMTPGRFREASRAPMRAPLVRASS
ncbi:AraC-like DNA-binding protein [Roseiarcus fermentans]|uniref:AraC-like DNA-binding protein n=1 Tax=Roseiarcus fermentans TaxID=1473586 RepID=A0A366FHA4_9HYPH|nr:AraC family transcriptional regulator [Roseiarcus fermentans]RBP13105.1 AraC-like DNA-binding protein [Roseiarcus fermentans]